MADCESAYEFAMEYPFRQPERDCVWSRGDVIDLAAWQGPGLAGRKPVLAIGSNASPEQLDRKFTPAVLEELGPNDGDIPIVRATAWGIDVVYGAYISSYWAIPATAVRAPPKHASRCGSPGSRGASATTWTGKRAARPTRVARYGALNSVASR